MFTFMVTLFVLISLLMVLVILMQSSKGGGLASSFGGMGGGGSFLGARGTANFLQKATMVLGILYGVITLFIGIYVSSGVAGGGQSEAEKALQKVAKENQIQTVPSVPFDPTKSQVVNPGQQQNTQPAAEQKETKPNSK